MPVRPGVGEAGVGDDVPVVGAGEGERERLPRGHEREVERLRVDRDAVLAELDGVAVEEVEPVAQRPPGLGAGRRDPALDLLGAHGVVEAAQLGDDLAEPFDHRVGREVRVDLVQ